MGCDISGNTDLVPGMIKVRNDRESHFEAARDRCHSDNDELVGRDVWDAVGKLALPLERSEVEQ